ncbi:MAG: triose-phosphate isomerase [Legionellaceae bacterium]|nr:triose-phosphate isomerase [Legionellaceae bacterium]
MSGPLIVGNWKMHGSLSFVKGFLEALRASKMAQLSQAVILPPVSFLECVQSGLQGLPIALGAQNVYPLNAGAVTGEISAPMLQEFGCRYVLVGHSERRSLFQETDEFVAQKFHHVQEHDMIPILCIGESLEARLAGATETVLKRQIEAVCLTKTLTKPWLLAYEPIWAIGTGQAATPMQAQDTHQYIRSQVEACLGALIASKLPILYGGSVTPENASHLLEMPDINGMLVGGASLKVESFLGILSCIK